MRRGIDVGQHRRRPGVDDGIDRGAESQRRGDDLVAGFQVRRQQAQMQGGGAGVDRGGMVGDALVGGELLLELGHARPGAEPARAQAGPTSATSASWISGAAKTRNGGVVMGWEGWHAEDESMRQVPGYCASSNVSSGSIPRSRRPPILSSLSAEAACCFPALLLSGQHANQGNLICGFTWLGPTASSAMFTERRVIQHVPGVVAIRGQQPGARVGVRQRGDEGLPSCDLGQVAVMFACALGQAPSELSSCTPGWLRLQLGDHAVPPCILQRQVHA